MVRFEDETLEERYPSIADESRRNFPVVKSNFFIQQARHNLSVQEMKLLWSLIINIKLKDDDLSPFYFSIRDFCNICGINSNNGKNYINIKNTLSNLSRKNFWLPLDEIGDKEKLFFWIRDVEISNHSKMIKITLDKNLKPYLIGLKRDFTKYKFGYIMTMKSQYSMRLYELLKSYLFRHTVIFELNEFKRLMNSENTFPIWSDFKRRVINKAIIEINNLTDIYITMKPIKDGNKVVEIRFNINAKNEQELIQSEKMITSRISKYKKIKL